MLKSCIFNKVHWLDLVLIGFLLLQFVIMPRVSGLPTAGDRCILGSTVSNGYPQCGHVE